MALNPQAHWGPFGVGFDPVEPDFTTASVFFPVDGFEEEFVALPVTTEELSLIHI